MYTWFLRIGGLFGALAVALGAFGAHVVKPILDPQLYENYQTAVQYHMYHTLALIGVAILSQRFPQRKLLSWSGWLFIVGIIIFSGSLYVLSLSGLRFLGAITPIGGVAFVVAWCLMAFSVVQND